MIRNANQFIRGQVAIKERDLEKMRITEEIQRQIESEMRYSDTNTIPSMVRMYDPVSGKLIAEFPYSEGRLSGVNTNFSASVILEPYWAWAGRRDDDTLKSACSLKDLFDSERGSGL